MLNNKEAGGKPFPYPAGKLPAEELSRLLAKYARPDSRVLVGPGIGRDATVISFPDRYLVAKTDPVTFATDQIGWYAVHVNANDVAAMGGRPRWFLATLLLPEGQTCPETVRAIFAQIAEACQGLEIVLCGGHTEISNGLNRPIVVGQMLGEAEKEKLVVPEGARAGDDIILTKGLAIEGTSLIARERPDLVGSLGEEWIKRGRELLKNPGISVVREACLANEIAPVHAMHDPTEGGVATGLHELALAAQLGLVIEMEKVPFLPETVLLCQHLKIDPLGLLASGSLLVVVPPENSATILNALEKAGIKAAVIGKICPQEEGVKIRVKGQAEDLPRFRRDELCKIFEERTG